MKDIIKWIFLLLVVPAFARETVLLAAEDDWYPYSAMRDGKLQGLSVEVIRAAFSAVDVDLRLDVVPFNRGMLLTKNGKYDGVFNSAMFPSMRADYQNPKYPIVLSEQVVYGKVGGPDVFGEESFKGKRLALTLGYTYPDTITKSQSILLDKSPTDLSSLLKVSSGRADFTIIDKLVALQIIERNRESFDGKVKPVGKLSSLEIFLIFNKRASGTRAMALYEKGMELIMGNGEYAKILSRWGANH